MRTTTPGIGAILLTGTGKAFCAGMDLAEALQADRSELDELHERLFTVGIRLHKPMIAGVHGAALAGGTGLAANAHILIACEEASFGLTEIRIGLWPILIFRAVKAAIGERRATELALTGRIFDGRKPVSYGLVHELSARNRWPRGGNRITNQSVERRRHPVGARVCKPEPRETVLGGETGPDRPGNPPPHAMAVADDFMKRVKSTKRAVSRRIGNEPHIWWYGTNSF